MSPETSRRSLLAALVRDDALFTCRFSDVIPKPKARDLRWYSDASPETSRRSLLAALVRDDTLANSPVNTLMLDFATIGNAVQVVRKIENNVTILDVDGVVKLGESARAFSHSLDQILREDRGPVMINFEAIDYMDSTGLGELIGYVQKFGQADRALALVKPSHRILSLLKLTRLDGVFHIFQSQAEAMAFLTAGDQSTPQS